MPGPGHFSSSKSDPWINGSDPWSGKQISEEKHVDLPGNAWQKWIQTSQSSREDRFEQRGELAGFVLDGRCIFSLSCSEICTACSTSRLSMIRAASMRSGPDLHARCMSMMCFSEDHTLQWAWQNLSERKPGRSTNPDRNWDMRNKHVEIIK